MSDETDAFPGKTKAWMRAFTAALAGRMTPCCGPDGTKDDYDPQGAVDHAWQAATIAEARAAKEHQAAQDKARAERQTAMDAIQVGRWYKTSGDADETAVQVVHVRRSGSSVKMAWFSNAARADFAYIVDEMELVEPTPSAKQPPLADAVRSVLGIPSTSSTPIRIDFDYNVDVIGASPKVLDVHTGGSNSCCTEDDWDRLRDAGIPLAHEKPLWLLLEIAAAEEIKAQRFWRTSSGVAVRFDGIQHDGGVSFVGPHGWFKCDRATEFLREHAPMTSEEYAEVTGHKAA